MSFWTFRQNNSGGSFDFDDERGISVNVIIEANSLDHAISRAKEIGLYFDGVEAGYDCECCGDRWYAPWDEEGNAVPSIYNTDVSSGAYEVSDDWSIIWSSDGIEGYIHFLDGHVVPVVAEKAH